MTAKSSTGKNTYWSSVISGVLTLPILAGAGIYTAVSIQKYRSEQTGLQLKLDELHGVIQVRDKEIHNLNTKIESVTGEALRAQAAQLGLVQPQEHQLVAFDMGGKRIFDNRKVASLLFERRSYGVEDHTQDSLSERRNARLDRPAADGQPDTMRN